MRGLIPLGQSSVASARVEQCSTSGDERYMRLADGSSAARCVFEVSDHHPSLETTSTGWEPRALPPMSTTRCHGAAVAAELHPPLDVAAGNRAGEVDPEPGRGARLDQHPDTRDGGGGWLSGAASSPHLWQHRLMMHRGEWLASVPVSCHPSLRTLPHRRHLTGGLPSSRRLIACPSDTRDVTCRLSVAISSRASPTLTHRHMRGHIDKCPARPHGDVDRGVGPESLHRDLGRSKPAIPPPSLGVGVGDIYDFVCRGGGVDELDTPDGRVAAISARRTLESLLCVRRFVQPTVSRELQTESILALAAEYADLVPLRHRVQNSAQSFQLGVAVGASHISSPVGSPPVLTGIVGDGERSRGILGG
jgi:hypothetical protein